MKPISKQQKLLAYEEAAPALQAGKVLCFQTDTVMGLHCLPNQVSKIISLKNCPNKPFILMISCLEDIMDEVELRNLSAYQLQQLNSIHQPPITWLVPHNGKNKQYQNLAKDKLLAVRMVFNLQIRQIIRSTGPLISTSANRFQEETADNLAEAYEIFGDRLEYCEIECQNCLKCPSIIKDLITGDVKRCLNYQK